MTVRFLRFKLRLIFAFVHLGRLRWIDCGDDLTKPARSRSLGVGSGTETLYFACLRGDAKRQVVGLGDVGDLSSFLVKLVGLCFRFEHRTFQQASLHEMAPTFIASIVAVQDA